MENNDVILLTDGRILQIESKEKSGLHWVWFVDRISPSLIDMDKVDIEKNFGNGPNAVLNFKLSQSVHSQLQKLLAKLGPHDFNILGV